MNNKLSFLFTVNNSYCSIPVTLPKAMRKIAEDYKFKHKITRDVLELIILMTQKINQRNESAVGDTYLRYIASCQIIGDELSVSKALAYKGITELKKLELLTTEKASISNVNGVRVSVSGTSYSLNIKVINKYLRA